MTTLVNFKEVTAVQVDFTKLKQEKQQNILNAALDEFAAKGYALASTNEIVRKAGISKGALFTYFPSKRELFLYLCDYSWNIVQTQYLEAIPDAEGDLIARLRAAVLLKMAVLRQHPKLINFLARILVEDDAEVLDRVRSLSAAAASFQTNVLYTGLNEALYRQDLPPRQASRMLCWCVDGYAADLTRQVQGQPLESLDIDQASRDFEDFIALLQKVFYR